MNKTQSNITLHLLTTLAIVGSLININNFGPVTLSAFFFYTISASAIIIITSITLLKSNSTNVETSFLPLYNKNVQLAVFSFLAIVAYYFLNATINPLGGINLRHYGMAINALLFLSLIILFKKGSINQNSISQIITFTALVEAIICIAQQFNLLPSLDSLFKVTGTCVNPNVTAMFLAMSIPAIAFVIFNSYKTMRYIAILGFLLTLLAMAFLQCRTAIIGTLVGTILYLNYQFQLIATLKKKYSKQTLSICTALFIIASIAALVGLVQVKKASSTGRLFIWKISLQAISQKPFFGSGYGQFEHDYNLAQANYFQHNTATPQEINNASYVRMSYNEYLENLFEGGTIGLLLFITFILSLLIPTIKPNQSLNQKNHGSDNQNTPLVIFATMSLFNFTVQALPVMVVFLLLQLKN